MVEFNDRRYTNGHFDLTTMKMTLPKPVEPRRVAAARAKPQLPAPPQKPAGPPPLTRSGVPLTEATGRQPNRFEPVKPAGPTKPAPKRNMGGLGRLGSASTRRKG